MMTDLATRAIIADGNFLISAGMAKILQDNVKIDDVVCTTDFVTTCNAVTLEIDFLVVSAELLLSEMNGLDGVRFLRKNYPDLRIILVSGIMPKSFILESFFSGVHGYVRNDMDVTAIVDVVQDVLAGRISIPQIALDPVPTPASATETAAPVAAYAGLTRRQQDVVCQMRRGCSNKEIGRALKITESTVKVHLAAAFRHLGVHNRVGVVAALQGQPLN
jgi:DNA-binding NarL/FixJ family response regulator